VIFAGLRQTPEMIVAAVIEEDVDVVGVSMHNGAHLSWAPAVIGALRQAGLATPVVVGGIVPEVDMPAMSAAGVAAVLGPGTSNDEVAASVKRAALAGSGHQAGPANPGGTA
jgi:methylmalonyl-CoA mutase C-terminal domain/subunit